MVDLNSTRSLVPGILHSLSLPRTVDRLWNAHCTGPWRPFETNPFHNKKEWSETDRLSSAYSLVFFGDITQNSCEFPITGCIVIPFAVTAARACFQKEGVVWLHAYHRGRHRGLQVPDRGDFGASRRASQTPNRPLWCDKGDVAQGQNSLTHSRSGVNCICTFYFHFPSIFHQGFYFILFDCLPSKIRIVAFLTSFAITTSIGICFQNQVAQWFHGFISSTLLASPKWLFSLASTQLPPRRWSAVFLNCCRWQGTRVFWWASPSCARRCFQPFATPDLSNRIPANDQFKCQLRNFFELGLTIIAVLILYLYQYSWKFL